MFKKLRNKFLIINMCITSSVMIAAFIIIYFITYSNIHMEIQSKLSSHPSVQMKIETGDTVENTEKGENGVSGNTKSGKVVSSTREMTLNDPISFNIEVDTQGKILSVNSFVEMPEEAYYRAAEMAWNKKTNNSPVTLEGKKWRYSVSQIITQFIDKNGQQVTSQGNRFNIIFLDVTESNKTLFTLLTTLIFVAIFMLIVIFIISLYFANRAIKPIAEAWEKQKQFVADASHELKTPLSIINANYDALMANQEETIKSQLKWLDYIRIGTDRMAKLINDLLTLAKIENVNLKIEKTALNVSSAVNETILSMEAVALEKGIKLSYSIEPALIINSHLESVKQVVTILLDNALKYTNENGYIHIFLIKSKRQLVYSIKNSGKGIVKEDLAKVFDRFYRADLSRTHENGSYGLGLSIAKTIINRLDGDIQAASVENEYTTFTFTLPL